MMIKAGVYVHIPFCLKKCAYCDFLSHAPAPYEIEAYMEALELEIERFKVEGQTLFIGGGTPSVVPPLFMKSLVAKLIKHYGPFSEATIEVNPGTVDKNYLKSLLEHGINRLSIGVQSFDDELLTRMGRLHTSSDAKSTVLTAKELGFSNINIDLIYGYPGSTMDSLEKSLSEAVSLPVNHISYYGLQLEEGTQLMKENIKPLSDEMYVQMYYRGINFLEHHGFIQYEVSNFAKRGFECQHNLIYWQNKPYLGLGVGAVSRLGKVRLKNLEKVFSYIEKIQNGQSTLTIEERLTDDLILKENIMLGLRLKQGISSKELNGEDLKQLYPELVPQLCKAGLLEMDSKGDLIYYRLTRKALPVMNSVLSCFF